MKRRLLRSLLALCTALALLSLSGCAVEKQEKTIEDFERAVSKTRYTLYEDNEDFEGKGFNVERAMVALSEDEQNRVEFFLCADEEAAKRLYESCATDIESAFRVAEEKEERDFTGDNYQCHGAQCDEHYFYRVQVGRTMLWATGNAKGKEIISKVVRKLDY